MGEKDQVENLFKQVKMDFGAVPTGLVSSVEKDVTLLTMKTISNNYTKIKSY